MLDAGCLPRWLTADHLVLALIPEVTAVYIGSEYHLVPVSRSPKD